MIDPRKLTWDGTPWSRAERFIVFCDGLEEAGLVAYARRGRVIARDLLAALDALEAERSARVALQTRCERQQEVLGLRVYRAAVEKEPG